jgi:CDP-Glycerol:Poly(glycerophosphate) glycerophosphotransferase.
MGFGEVAQTEEELVNLIIEYIENDCKLKEEFRERIDAFFVYHDKNNCKRVYDRIKEIPLKD